MQGHTKMVRDGIVAWIPRDGIERQEGDGWTVCPDQSVPTYDEKQAGKKKAATARSDAQAPKTDGGDKPKGDGKGKDGAK